MWVLVLNVDNTSAVSIVDVEKYYDSLCALNGINLQIEQGEFFGLLGPNGAGKSTLINSLAGLVRASKGRLSVMGYDVVSDYRKARQQLGVVPQELAYDPFFTVREALRFQSGYFGIKHNDAWIDQLLESLSLQDKTHANLRSLSGGMKRRVLIALALVHRPPVVVLDEPTAGVDVELRQTLWAFVKSLHKQGHTIVLTTHYLEEAEQLCDRIAIIDQGELIALESKKQLLARGLGSKLFIRAKNTIDNVPTGLRKKVVRQQANELEISLHREQDNVIDILDQLRAHGIAVEHINVQEDSLEDVFVRLTSKKTPAKQQAKI